MPRIAPTSNRFVSLLATLRVSDRLVGPWLAGRTEIPGMIVSLSTDGGGQFHYLGPSQWWLQLRARSSLRVDRDVTSVRIVGHQVHAESVVVDFLPTDGRPLLPAGAQAMLDEQQSLDTELDRYWNRNEGTSSGARPGPDPGPTQALPPTR